MRFGQHSSAGAARAADGHSDRELPWLHVQRHLRTHRAVTWTAATRWQMPEICIKGKTAALFSFLQPQLSSLQLGCRLCRVPSCTQVMALRTGEIMTGAYRFQKHAAPPGCASAFKEQADIWETWPSSPWERIPKYTISLAKWLQPGGHQDIAWYSGTWIKTTACWL